MICEISACESASRCVTSHSSECLLSRKLPSEIADIFFFAGPEESASDKSFAIDDTRCNDGHAIAGLKLGSFFTSICGIVAERTTASGGSHGASRGVLLFARALPVLPCFTTNDGTTFPHIIDALAGVALKSRRLPRACRAASAIAPPMTPTGSCLIADAKLGAWIGRAPAPRGGLSLICPVQHASVSSNVGGFHSSDSAEWRLLKDTKTIEFSPLLPRTDPPFLMLTRGRPCRKPWSEILRRPFSGSFARPVTLCPAYLPQSIRSTSITGPVWPIASARRACWTSPSEIEMENCW
mmetsp:Transcript_4607/g.11051  ORF Transcript_4607/g.11051 Transcript_4607/m.11051 type:complete len:296 (+) Transcript_4607:112-999(+)